MGFISHSKASLGDVCLSVPTPAHSLPARPPRPPSSTAALHAFPAHRAPPYLIEMGVAEHVVAPLHGQHRRLLARSGFHSWVSGGDGDGRNAGRSVPDAGRCSRRLLLLPRPPLGRTLRGGGRRRSALTRRLLARVSRARTEPLSHSSGGAAGGVKRGGEVSDVPEGRVKSFASSSPDDPFTAHQHTLKSLIINLLQLRIDILSTLSWE